MKYAIVTDNHAGCRNDSLIFLEYTISFFEKQFIPYLLENNITSVIHLGDVFDRRKYINFNTLYEWRTRVFDVLLQNKIELHVILGNHDVYYKNTNLVSGAYEFLKTYDNCHVYDKPIDVFLDNVPVLFVPWIPMGEEQLLINSITNSNSSVCMGHLEIKGFEMHTGQVNIDHGFDVDCFQKFSMVLSGHFHHKSSSLNIHYLGSPYQMTWNDWGDVRGFHIFDTDSFELTFIPNKSEIFKKIYYNDENKTYYQLFSGYDFDTLKNMYVKLIVEKKDNAHLYEQFLGQIYNAGPADLSIVEQGLISEINDGVIDNAKDTLTILKDCVLSLDIDHKDKLNDLFTSLYNEAIAMDVE
jgi:DNA repair exonuclease SbcCD nuclease subunit